MPAAFQNTLAIVGGIVLLATKILSGHLLTIISNSSVVVTVA
jgi:hypothetical protein